MTGKSELLRTIHERIDKSGIPPTERDCLLELLNLLILTTQDIPDELEKEQLTKRLIEAIADNGQLLTTIRHQASELDALRRITLNLTSSLELQEVLSAVVAEAMRLVHNANDAHIFLYNSQEDKLTFGAALDVNGQRDVPYAVPRPDGLTHKVARSGKSIVINNIAAHPLYTEHQKKRTGSIIGLPLLVGSRVVGVMNMARTTVGPFSQSEIRLLSLLADQAAIAIVNARLHRAVALQARIDVLTGLPNRRALDERLEEEIIHAHKTKRPLTVIMMDLDGFKSINDTYGHDTGDIILRTVAQSLLQTLRATDYLARYGGDEMTLILPNTTLSQCQVVVDKILEHMQSLSIPIPDGKKVSMALSGGIAQYPKHASTAPGMLRAADEALYRAKRHQRGAFLIARMGTGDLDAPKTS
ncbi:MAG: sensor domain-containing diguanylate cyclase [Chloroflexota bacterium]